MVISDDNKLFKDPVHGYISVPGSFCRHFIDTPIFQRLRNIEQTSMRCLYPGAHHDRFVHSLGVFHVGQLIYSALEKNTTDSEILDILRDDKLRNTFGVACLMHDCGHAPFSHTLEKFFITNGKTPHNRAFSELHKILPVEPDKNCAPHEAMSAVVLNTCFTGSPVEWDCELSCRMITGYRHLPPKTLRHQVENALIGALSGPLDVDKLDYILRDTWASGVKNYSIDLQRLVGAALLEKTGEAERQRVVLAYKKSALSVIQAVVDARNYLYVWVYNHHKVCYNGDLLFKLVEKLSGVIGTADESKSSLERMFSVQMFSERISLRGDENPPYAYRVDDGDIGMFLKTFLHDDPAYHEYVSRTSRYFPLWKSRADLRAYFSEYAKDVTKKKCLEVLSETVNASKDEIVIVDAEAKIAGLKAKDVHVLMGDKLCLFTEVVGVTTPEADTGFFYVYIDKKYKNKKENMLKALHESTH